MNNERKILKTLLLQEELDLLEKLKHKLLSKEQFTQEVSEVLAGAIKRSNKSNNRLKNALKEPINLGIQKAFSDNKQSIIDSILPIMGQLIRKTVTNSIKRFVSDINRTLELKFSIKYIKWRWQAYKAGIPFAEMVFQKTIQYQVEELFFVDRETGLLIEYAGSDELIKNKDAISSMLTAIQDFIGDSLQLSKSELVSAEIGDNLILITTGPHAYLATVIKGSPTERLKEKLQQLVETIHADFGDDFTHQENFRNLPELSSLLKENLIKKSVDESNQTNKINFIPWIFGLLLILFYFAYNYNQKRLEFNFIEETAVATPGLFVKSIDRSPSGFLINGLVDPLANLSQLQQLGVQFNTTSFISLDSEMILKRANRILEDFPEVDLTMVNNNFEITGKIRTNRLDQLKQRLLLTSGINKLIDKTIVDIDDDLRQFFSSKTYLNKAVDYKIDQKTVLIEGETNYDMYQQMSSQFIHLFQGYELISDKLNIVDSNEKLFLQVQETVLDMPYIDQPEESKNLANVINLLHILYQRETPFKLSVIGKSDCNNIISDNKSRQRVNKIKQVFTEANLPINNISFEIAKCPSYNFPRDRNKRTVEFMVNQ